MSDPMHTRIIKVSESDALSVTWFLKDGGEYHMLYLCPSPEQMQPDVVCEHGVAMDVHCCGCHSGFLFDSQSCRCLTHGVPS